MVDENTQVEVVAVVDTSLDNFVQVIVFIDFDRNMVEMDRVVEQQYTEVVALYDFL